MRSYLQNHVPSGTTFCSNLRPLKVRQELRFEDDMEMESERPQLSVTVRNDWQRSPRSAPIMPLKTS